jgi:signal transduction histidine kinase
MRDLWLPALVAIVGITVSFAGWGLLVGERRDQIRAVATGTGVETRETIEVGLDHQLETLRGVRDLVDGFGLQSIEKWKVGVGQRIDRVPGLRSVTWVDLERSQAHVSAGEERSPREVAHELERAPFHRDRPGFEGPDHMPDGTISYRVYLPARTPEGRAGVLVGRFVPDSFLESVLTARARGYALTVFWGDEQIFSRGTPTADPWQEWWRAEEKITLPLGGQPWRVVLRPTPQFAAMRLTPVPHYLLAAGIVLSLVLALAAYELRLIVRQSRFLAVSNLALEERSAELEVRVAERTEALQEAVSELEAFNYSVSHDLRSPLGAILNFVAILEEDFRDVLDPEAGVLLDRIRRSATRATTLLEDLLQLSRAGRSALKMECVDMAALARETFAQVYAAEDLGEVELVVDPLPDARGDRTLLGDVFANLLGNALKYSRGTEKPRITVQGRIEGPECVYEVADNGEGFDMRYADKLFGLFERLHKDDEVKGTGVGLAMVARIVKRHGGRVWAEGRLGEGARFSFTLPQADGP